MFKLTVSRIALAVPQLLLLTLLVFCLTYLIPGSPAAAILGASATPDGIAKLESQLGLDRPFFVRLGEYYVNLFQGDLGTSYLTGRPVTQMFAERLPATLSILVGGVIVGVLVGLALGIIGGTKPGSLRDRISTAITAITMSIPEFFFGIILLVIFAVQLGLFPVVSWVPPEQSLSGWFVGLILPSLSLGICCAALIARQTRTSMAQSMSSRYIDSLTAAGVPRQRLIFRYGLKNALVPVLSSMGITVSIMLGASFAVEKVFSVPGIGSLLLRSVTGKDYAVVQTGVLIVAGLVILVNIVLDIIFGLVNPKARPE
ncbi:ABC transporter permease [Gulosibacter faecalis]|uniref:ABC transporter permease n=1 Tax=Gulosibacter faecalis TaxID=272240 RepID=A0ABW5V0D9_9MICO|nr:ABC transporter permease [Gulosibacter faecalis]